MELPADVVQDVRTRLHRAEGQIRALDRMLDEGRECRDIVTQIAAATKALEQAGFRLVAAGLQYCIENPAESEASGYPLDELRRLFIKLT